MPQRTEILPACRCRDSETSVQPGDRIVVVFAARGESTAGDVIFVHPMGSEGVSVQEMSAALKMMPSDVNLFLINGRCFSGRGVNLARAFPGTNDILVESASLRSELSYNYRSASGAYHVVVRFSVQLSSV